METVNLGLLVLTTIFGGTSFFTLFLFRRQQKRFKNAEAVEKEVDSLRKTVDTLQQNQKFYEERLNVMQSMLVEKDSYITVLSRDKNVLEIKHAKNKKAINSAHECKFCSETIKCPVLVQRSKNEEEYLQHIEKSSNN